MVYTVVQPLLKICENKQSFKGLFALLLFMILGRNKFFIRKFSRNRSTDSIGYSVDYQSFYLTAFLYLCNSADEHTSYCILGWLLSSFSLSGRNGIRRLSSSLGVYNWITR